MQNKNMESALEKVKIISLIGDKPISCLGNVISTTVWNTLHFGMTPDEGFKLVKSVYLSNEKSYGCSFSSI